MALYVSVDLRGIIPVNLCCSATERMSIRVDSRKQKGTLFFLYDLAE